MSKVAIVTDSTAYIPQSYLEKYTIRVAPQVLIWDGKTYEDGIDILPNQFYERLKNSKTLPTTSQATPGSFQEIFSNLAHDGYEILSILISEKLSGTISSAKQAKEMVPEATVEIVDSMSTAMEMGFHVLAAARAAEQGASLAECKHIAEEARKSSGILFTVDTLEFLHRGGRIGGAARLLGSALKINPILEMCEGRLEPLEKVRTRTKAVNRLIELAERSTGQKKPSRVAVLHANVKDEAAVVLDMIKDRIGAEEAILSDVSPVVGSHTGPGTLAIAYMTGW